MNDRTLTSVSTMGGDRPGAMVVCVGATQEQCSAVTRSLGTEAEILVAPDTRSALALLQGRGGRDVRPTLIEHGPLRIDETEREVLWAGKPITLCAREFDLLTTLARDWGRVWSFAELTEAVWKRPYIGDSDAVISAVKRLRRRVGATTHDLAIASVRGVGFRLTMRRSATPAPSAASSSSANTGTTTVSDTETGGVAIRKAG